MKTFVLNCGSSSLKFQLIDPVSENLLAKGVVEKIGTEESMFGYKPIGMTELHEIRAIPNHAAALKQVLNCLTSPEHGVMTDINDIEAIGHRVVHGGERFTGSVLIDAEVIQAIHDCSAFAPLHNPANLIGIEACHELMPTIPQVAVFDTAFHQQIPAHAYLYALPYSIYERFRIRRYGFHGTSHRYVSEKAAQLLQRSYQDFRVITCHLGNGSSIAAVRNGASIDTSMGFTPLEGLVMGTRCGDIDPAIIPYLMAKDQLSPNDIDTMMNKHSGLKGITQTTNDMREIEQAIHNGSRQHELAMDIFCYRIRKYIGAYLTVLNGADAIVFTAGIGENSIMVREKTCQNMEALGICLDPELNRIGTGIISTGSVKVMVVPTNEELAIAQETNRILTG
jgi:acetate kinase